MLLAAIINKFYWYIVIYKPSKRTSMGKTTPAKHINIFEMEVSKIDTH